MLCENYKFAGICEVLWNDPRAITPIRLCPCVRKGFPWWRHQMETFFASLAICAGNSPVSGEFPAQRPVTRSFDVFFELRLNERLSKQSWGWWSETPSCPLWRHSDASLIFHNQYPISLTHCYLMLTYGIEIFALSLVTTVRPCYNCSLKRILSNIWYKVRLRRR